MGAKVHIQRTALHHKYFLTIKNKQTTTKIKSQSNLCTFQVSIRTLSVSILEIKFWKFILQHSVCYTNLFLKCLYYQPTSFTIPGVFQFHSLLHSPGREWESDLVLNCRRMGALSVNRLSFVSEYCSGAQIQRYLAQAFQRLVASVKNISFLFGFLTAKLGLSLVSFTFRFPDSKYSLASFLLCCSYSQIP